MNDLPDPTSPGNITVDKEREGIPGGLEAPVLKEFGKDKELPAEVVSAGVTIRPTTVPIPKTVQNLGVQQVGTPAPQTTQTVSLPLSDDQIAQGLHQSITSSWRWLAQWCIRRLKQLHVSLKKVHGKFIQVKQHA